MRNILHTELFSELWLDRFGSNRSQVESVDSNSFKQKNRSRKEKNPKNPETPSKQPIA
jgi:hypothetical protein